MSAPIIIGKATADKNLTDVEFAHWLSGFSDAESSFIILLSQLGKRSRNAEEGKLRERIIFRFQIKLHSDDTKVLKYIQQRLGMGSVRVIEGKAIFTVVSPKDLLKLLSLFDIKPLNTTKYLNYLVFKEALLLYYNNQGNPNNKDLIVEKVREIKNTMNTQRTNFEFPESHSIVITPYWLLGFVEGDGSFNVTNLKTGGVKTNFSISQAITDKKVLEAIRNFILDLPGSYINRKITSNQVGIITKKETGVPTQKQQMQLNINDSNFISAVLMPFFSNLTFVTKKGLDFIDWQNILELKNKGWHLSSYGANLIKALAMEMNNHRLNTNQNLSSSESNQNSIANKVKDLLSQPSNF